MDINPDPGCGRAMDPDIVLHHSLGLDVTKTTQVAAQAIQISTAPLAVWSSDTNMGESQNITF